jgi:hypothetical protein
MSVLPFPSSHGSDPWTAFAAAAAIAPYQGTIAQRVLNWHRTYSAGLIDDELRVLMHSTIQTDSSHRKRRCELTQVGYLEDSGLCRLNREGNPEVVWQITELGQTGPWPIPKPRQPKGVRIDMSAW